MAAVRTAAPLDDAGDAIALLKRFKLELDDEIQEFRLSEAGGSLCREIAQLAYDITDSACDHVIHKSWKETKQRWAAKREGSADG